MKLAYLHGPAREEAAMLPKGLCHAVIAYEGGGTYSAEQMRQLSQCDALYATAAPVTPAVFQACPDLKMVQCSGSGYDGVDVEAATRHGVLVCNNADTNAGRTADFAMLAVLALLRNYVKTVVAMQPLHGGEAWEEAKREGCAAQEVQGKTLGILGFGDIGHRLALRADAFGMKIIYCDIDRNAHLDTARKLGARRVSLDELCRRSDVVSVHVPLDGSTRRMLGERQFGLMKQGAFVICNSRGDIVDEAALRRALDSGRVAGAAMDVFSTEPVQPGNPLIGAPNLYPTPHVASRGREGVVRSFLEGIENIRRFMVSGKLPANVVNPEARPDLFRKAAAPKPAGTTRKKAVKKVRKQSATKLPAAKSGTVKKGAGARKPAKKARRS